HPQYHCYYRYLCTLLGFGRNRRTDFTGLSRFWTAAADTQLGRAAATGLDQPGSMVDFRFRDCGHDRYIDHCYLYRRGS
ncbi:MAG: hypothetical protein V3V39_02470, partial [Desulfobacterales bacterium]